MMVFGWVLGALAVVALGCFPYAVFIEQKQYKLRQIEIPILPPGHPPIRLLHLADLHLLPSHTKKQSWVRALAELKPDLVINTGDNLGTVEAMPSLAAIFEPFASVPGVFVLGSNDIYASRPINPLKYFAPRRAVKNVPNLPTDELVAIMTSIGWASAEQQRLVFTLQDTQIEIRGCGDAHIRADDYPKVMGELSPQTDLLIGVTHAPYSHVLDLMVSDGTSLILTGHTHGGQVCLPGGRALTTNCDLPTKQARGLSQHHCSSGSAYLHVSAGLGTSPYAPYRFCCPPEASLITLVERPPQNET